MELCFSKVLTVALLHVHVSTSRSAAYVFKQSSQSAFPHALPASWVTAFWQLHWFLGLNNDSVRTWRIAQTTTRSHASLKAFKTSHANFFSHTWAPSSSKISAIRTSHPLLLTKSSLSWQQLDVSLISTQLQTGRKKDLEGFLYDFKWGKYLGQGGTRAEKGFVAEKWEMFPSALIKP